MIVEKLFEATSGVTEWECQGSKGYKLVMYSVLGAELCAAAAVIAVTLNSVVVATLFGSHAGTVFQRGTLLSRLDSFFKM